MDEKLKRRLLGPQIKVNWKRFLLAMGLGVILLVLFVISSGFLSAWHLVGEGDPTNQFQFILLIELVGLGYPVAVAISWFLIYIIEKLTKKDI
jgi:hypothetical protein